MRHINLPIFIPHLGCPNDCVFCNQRKISGKSHFCIERVREDIDTFLATCDKDNTEVQLAFFGGSFTGIDREDMLYLLKLAKEYTDRGSISSIRLSTRPDYIDEEILQILKCHGVRAIELGIQSMSDKVLSACKRGHSVQASEDACRLIKDHGFELVGQMMTALPSSTPEDEVYTAKRLTELSVDGARIYPTMVFHGTELEDMYRHGIYTPPTLEELTERTEMAFSVFCKANVPVIRIGLQASDGLDDPDGIVAGEYRSAMGELVISRYYLKHIIQLLDTKKDELQGKDLSLLCAKGEISKVIGQKKKNKYTLCRLYGLRSFKVIESDDVNIYDIKEQNE